MNACLDPVIDLVLGQHLPMRALVPCWPPARLPLLGRGRGGVPGTSLDECLEELSEFRLAFSSSTPRRSISWFWLRSSSRIMSVTRRHRIGQLGLTVLGRWGGAAGHGGQSNRNSGRGRWGCTGGGEHIPML